VADLLLERFRMISEVGGAEALEARRTVGCQVAQPAHREPGTGTAGAQTHVGAG